MHGNQRADRGGDQPAEWNLARANDIATVDTLTCLQASHRATQTAQDQHEHWLRERNLLPRQADDDNGGGDDIGGNIDAFNERTTHNHYQPQPASRWREIAAIGAIGLGALALWPRLTPTPTPAPETPTVAPEVEASPGEFGLGTGAAD